MDTLSWTITDSLDILRGIFRGITDWKTWQALALVNKATAVVASEHPDIREELTNPLWRFLVRYPDANYDFPQLSSSRYITGKLLARFPYSWDYRMIVNNGRVSVQAVYEYPNLPWDWPTIYNIRGLNIDFIVKFADRPFNWKAITLSTAISFKDILTHPLPWCFDKIKNRHDITTEDIIKYSSLGFSNWWFIGNDDIDASMLIPLDADFSTHLATAQYIWRIYHRKDIFEIVRKFPAFPWNAKLLSQSRYLTPEIIEEFPIDWDFSKICI